MAKTITTEPGYELPEHPDYIHDYPARIISLGILGIGAVSLPPDEQFELDDSVDFIQNPGDIWWVDLVGKRGSHYSSRIHSVKNVAVRQRTSLMVTLQ